MQYCTAAMLWIARAPKSLSVSMTLRGVSACVLRLLVTPDVRFVTYRTSGWWPVALEEWNCPPGGVCNDPDYITLDTSI